MKCSRCLVLLFVLGGLCTLGAGPMTLGAEPAAPGEPGADRVKPPKAGKELLQVFKNLAKTKNYKVEVSIEGGLSDNTEHKVTTANVRETYDGEVFRSPRSQLMHVPSLKAYRTPKAGAINAGGWKDILADSTRAGIRMHRLFAFPEIILERASRFQGSAEWVDESSASKTEEGAAENEGAETAKAKDAKKPAPQDSPKAEEKEVRKGKTVVVNRGGSSGTISSSLPRIIRVEAPTKEALTHFLEVENSGCFGGG